MCLLRAKNRWGMKPPFAPQSPVASFPRDARLLMSFPLSLFLVSSSYLWRGVWFGQKNMSIWHPLKWAYSSKPLKLFCTSYELKNTWKRFLTRHFILMFFVKKIRGSCKIGITWCTSNLPLYASIIHSKPWKENLWKARSHADFSIFS